jgi:hypothetical protein
MSEDIISDHHNELVTAFAEVIAGETDERLAKDAIKAVEDRYASQIRQGQNRQRDAWARIAKLMAETGEVEVILPDLAQDYKLAYNTPPEKVDVPDESAVPDEWCKLERAVKKKELLSYLKGLRDVGDPMPNWATLQRGSASLGYKLIKKKSAA